MGRLSASSQSENGQARNDRAKEPQSGSAFVYVEPGRRGKVLELILSGMVERSLDTYRSPRYRIGIYRARPSNGGAEYADDLKRIHAFLARQRASIGRTRYDYLKVVKLGFVKTFGIRLKQPTDYDVTPNDMARSV